MAKPCYPAQKLDRDGDGEVQLAEWQENLPPALRDALRAAGAQRTQLRRASGTRA